MSELNTIYDSGKDVVLTGRLGLVWTRLRRRMGGYDYGDVGHIYDCDGAPVASFENGRITSSSGEYIGHFVEVSFSEFYQSTLPAVNDSLVKRLHIHERVVGWCIGNPGSASAAVVLLFSKQPA